MSRFAKLFAANTIALAGLAVAGWGAALSLSASASAEPALPPAIPDVPALNAIQQLATNPAGVGAILQSAATALNGASQVVSPAQTLPVSPINVPGAAPVSPALSPALYPPAAPVTPAASPASALMGPASTLLPLLNQIGIPGSLINLAPAATPVAPAAVAPVAPVVPIAPAAMAPAAPAVPLLPAANLLTALP